MFVKLFLLTGYFFYGYSDIKFKPIKEIPLMANKKLLIDNVRCHYPTLAEAKGFENGDNPDKKKYSIKILIPKEDKEQVKKIEDFIKESIAESSWKAGQKAEMKKVAFDNSAGNKNYAVLKDGDLINQHRTEIQDKDPIEAYKGHYVITCNRSQKFAEKAGPPMVVGQDGKPVTDPSDIEGLILAGYWVNVQVQGYSYVKPEIGFSLSLSAVQLRKRDTVFGQENPFEEIEPEDFGAPVFDTEE